MEKGQTWDVLDHGYVKFIGSMGSDEEVVEAARMSTGKGFISWDPVMACKTCGWKEGDVAGGCDEHDAHHIMEMTRGDGWLLEFLYSNKHMTPFEMPELCIEVKAPIFVFREWHRHRTQSYNEFSARYAKMANEHYIPALDRIVKQSKSNKQGSGEAFPLDDATAVRSDIAEHQSSIYQSYENYIERGVANEIARVNTPVSRYSKMRAKTDLRNWLGFMLLRMAPNAQWEIRQYANVVAEIVKTLYPKTYELFDEYTLNAVTFSKTEMVALRALLRKVGVDPEKGSLSIDDKRINARFVASLMSKLK